MFGCGIGGHKYFVTIQSLSPLHLSQELRVGGNDLISTVLFRASNLKVVLAKYAATYKEDWDIYLPSVLFAYRTMINSTTRHEPFYLTYGREAIFPIELQIPTYPTEISGEEQKEELLLKRS
ncbi:16416_t:CDS:2 [Entrophospora sp. SA101]|nr:16416_t:CDS:2 [Entrophospora sp. SA101]